MAGRKPSYLTDTIAGLGLGLLTATWTARHQPWAGLLAAAGVALLLLLALLTYRRATRHAPPASPTPRPENRYPPQSWPEQPPATTPTPADRPSADFDHWQRADRHTVINALDAGQLGEVVGYMASLDPELFGHAVRSLDEQA